MDERSRVKPPIPIGDIEAMACVAAFLVYCERDHPGMMYGSHTVEEAIVALAHTIGCTPKQIRQIGGTR